MNRRVQRRGDGAGVERDPGRRPTLHTMTRTRHHLALAAIALLVLAPAAPHVADTASAARNSFAIEQGDRCVAVEPLEGDQNVEAFYDYRKPQNSDAYTYSSYMPGHLTREDASRLFLYEGPDGVSLVMVHNERGGSGDGSAATFRFSGLPTGGEWAVVDDDYGDRDDRSSRTRLDWSWYGDRTDGGAFRGVDRSETEITIRAAFDDDAALYDEPVDRSGTTRAWQFLSGSLDDPDAVGLQMNRPVTIRAGSCTDETPPSAALSVGDGVAGQPVTLDAGDASDDRGVAEYRWDLDGDGEVDRRGSEPSVGVTYDEPGEYRVRVTVADAADNTDSAAANVTVEPDEPPAAALGVATDEPTAGYGTVLDASNSTDDHGVAEYRWDLDGDGEIDRTTDGPRTEYVYEESGSYDAGVTAVDAANQTATASATVSVAADEPPSPTLRVAEPDDPAQGEQIVFDASNSTDDTGIAEYRWRFGDDATATGERVTHRYDDNGTYEVALEVVDEAGNNATETVELAVLSPDETPPEPAASADPATVPAGANVSFDASDSTDNRGVESYRWAFGDGATATGETATHAYGSPGNYTATLTATDRAGHANRTTVAVRVRAPDTSAPNASLSVADETDVGEDVTFNASGSTDDRRIAAYRWDFDGGGTDETTADATASHAYDEPGTYNATVTVLDGGDNADTATAQVVVEEERALGGGGGGSGGSGGSSGAGGGGGGGAAGPPSVVTDAESRGPNAGAVDVRNGRADDPIRASLPATDAAAETGVRFREVVVDLAADDSHFVVETARGARADGVPGDRTLGSLSVGTEYLDASTVGNVTYVASVERSRLDGADPGDLAVYQRRDGAWERLNATVEEREDELRVRAESDAVGAVAVGVDAATAVTDAALSADEVAAGDPVTVTATVENEGGDAERAAVNLSADGAVVATESVSVPAGETAEVELAAALDPGTHELAVAGEPVGTVTVAESPAELSVAGVSVNASTVRPGEPVAVTATVENRGGAAGEREVALTLSGERVATETVEVPAGETKEVTFVRAVEATGTHSARVGDATAEFEVTDAGSDTPDAPVPGFGPVAAAVALVAAALLVRRQSA